MLCFDLTNFREVINDCLLKEITDNVYYQHVSGHTALTHLLKALNNRTAFAFTKPLLWGGGGIRHRLLKNIGVLVHTRPSRMSKSSGKGSLSLIGDWVWGLDHICQKSLRWAAFWNVIFIQSTVKEQFTNHTFCFGMHISRYRSQSGTGQLAVTLC